MIFFKDKASFDRFIKGQFAFQASASAVAVEAGDGKTPPTPTASPSSP